MKILFINKKVNGSIRTWIRYIFLRQKKQHVRRPADTSIFRLHISDVLHILFDVGHGWLLFQSQIC